MLFAVVSFWIQDLMPYLQTTICRFTSITLILAFVFFLLPQIADNRV